MNLKRYSSEESVSTRFDFLNDYEIVEDSTNTLGPSDYDTAFVPEIDQINDKIYLGNYDSARFKAMLQMRGITHVLTCGKNMEPLHKDDFEYLIIPVRDTAEENIKVFFQQCFEFIDKAEKVFVHCQYGVSRSATIVIAYLMWKNKASFKNALKYVMSKRKIIGPNEGFLKQLKEFEEEVLEKNNNNKYFCK